MTSVKRNASSAEPHDADRDLVERAVAGDTQAFGELARREEKFMYAVAIGRLGDPHLARDAVQEALLSAWRHRAQLRDPAAFRGWLGRIVFTTAVSLGRKRNTSEVGLVEESIPASPAPDSERRKERMATLSSAMTQLEEDKQVLLALHYSDGLSYAEIAGQLGISEGAVRGRMFHAREKLRGLLKGKLP